MAALWSAARAFSKRRSEVRCTRGDEESKPEWYLRQMLGTANFDAGPLMAFSSGNVCYQIKHHLFPDLPSNRYAEIATRAHYSSAGAAGPIFP
jgi:fatty acid desaturase